MRLPIVVRFFFLMIYLQCFLFFPSSFLFRVLCVVLFLFCYLMFLLFPFSRPVKHAEWLRGMDEGCRLQDGRHVSDHHQDPLTLIPPSQLLEPASMSSFVFFFPALSLLSLVFEFLFPLKAHSGFFTDVKTILRSGVNEGKLQHSKRKEKKEKPRRKKKVDVCDMANVSRQAPRCTLTYLS